SAGSAAGSQEGIDDDEGGDRDPDGGGRLRKPGLLDQRFRGRQGLEGQGRAGVVVRVQEAAALQGKQQRERRADDQHGGNEQDDDRDQGSVRGARVAQRHISAG